MKGRSLLAAFLLTLALVTGVTSAAVGTGGEVTFEEHDETPTPTPHSEGESAAQNDSSSHEGDSSDPERILREVDSDLVVTGVSWNRTEGDLSQVVFTFKNRKGGGGSNVDLTEGISREAAEESKRFGIKSVTVPDGETVEVVLNLYTSDPIGVMIVSDQSREEYGGGTFMSAPSPEFSLLKGAATWADVRAGAFFAMLASILLVLLGSWQLVASRNTDLQEADLEPDERRWTS